MNRCAAWGTQHPVAKEKTAGKGQYHDVVEQLQSIVDALESGELSLEESLARFEKGVQLVREGERMLTDAEKRIEQLLSEDGRTAPLKLPENESAATSSPAAPAKGTRAPAAAPAADDDVPF